MLDRRKIRDHRGHHPWLTISHFPDWRVRFTHDLPAKHLGLTVHADREVLIRPGLSVEARRATLAHETGHVMRGPGSACHTLREESLVERQAARLLIPTVQRLGHAMAWHRADYARTARELWVDEKLLNARISTLTPAERAWLQDQLAAIMVDHPA